jgi:hypothetical protein
VNFCQQSISQGYGSKVLIHYLATPLNNRLHIVLFSPWRWRILIKRYFAEIPQAGTSAKVWLTRQSKRKRVSFSIK